MTGVLYHYSCAHAAPGIARDGFVKPMVPWRRLDEILIAHADPMTGLWRAPAVVWLTDLDEPRRHALGLTSFTLDCDRTEFRFSVERRPDATPWLDFAARWGANPRYLRSLLSNGGEPEHWFVCPSPLAVIETVDRRQLCVSRRRSPVSPPEQMETR